MNKLKNNLMMWLIPLLIIIMITGCEDRDGITYPPITTTPTVVSTNPANAATNVPINQQITATFSEEMNATTITTASFTLMHGTSFISGTVSYSGTTAIFTPSSYLEPNTLYTATITTGAKNLGGGALASNYVWSFTAGEGTTVIAPAVISTVPVNAETNVALNQKIAVTFNVEMDPATFTSASFLLRQGVTPVAGLVSYTGTTAIFAPTELLAPNTAYTVIITTGVKDLAGTSLAGEYVFGFTTGASVVVTPPVVSFTDPANGETGVALNQKISATFSKVMDASTITASTFTLKQGSTPVSGFVSYSGTTALFTPTSNLAPNTVYTATITTGAKDLAGNALVNNYEWSFTTGAAVVVTPPIVISTDPVNAATNVSLNQKVSATFSKTMDPTTIHSSTFILRQGTTSVSGFVSYSGTTAIFSPASLLQPNTIYTATITTGAKDLAGNPLANDYTWSFTTGAAVVVTPPTVISTDPFNAETNVALNQKVSATFSKTMDASTINASTFTLKQGTTSVTGFVSYSGTTALLTPASDLAPNTVYTATITTGAKDLAGNPLVNNYIWNFTTGSSVVVTPPTVISTDPINLETNVPLNQKVSATFSKMMDPTSIQTSTFILKQGTTSVTGFVSYSGTTALFTPASNLAPNTVYTATITTGAKDLAGNALADNYVWSFTTGSSVVDTPPTIISTDPVDGEICVPVNKHVTATFSKPMDASTITTAVFTVMELGFNTFVSGTVTYSGTTATFVPLIDLKENRTYRATITTGAKDLTGNSMTENYEWIFTTITPYTVSLSSNPLNGGTTSGGGTFYSCSVVTVTATPNSGFTFINWTENGLEVSTDANYTFELTANRTLVANFEEAPPQLYTVSLSSDPLDGGTTSGGGEYESGTVVTVTATPNTGYLFVNWTEGGVPVSTNQNYTFTLVENRALVANFEETVGQFNVSLSANPIEGGTVNGDGNYDSGSEVTVTATPNDGFTFINWTENGLEVSTDANYTFVILANRILVANFEALPSGPAGVDLGSAGDFAILAGSGVTNTGFTFVYGDVGSFPTATIDGFPPGVVDGTLYMSADPIVETAKNDLTAAYNDAQGRSLDAISLPGQLGGLTLAPGLYVNSSTSGISGTGPQGILTLDAGGNPNAVWIFKMGSTLITDPGTSIVLAGGAKWENIYWSVGTSATFGTNSIFYGNVLADQSISLNTGASLRGRALTRIAAVTLDTSVVDKR